MNWAVTELGMRDEVLRGETSRETLRHQAEHAIGRGRCMAIMLNGKRCTARTAHTLHVSGLAVCATHRREAQG